MCDVYVKRMVPLAEALRTIHKVRSSAPNIEIVMAVIAVGMLMAIPWRRFRKPKQIS